MRATSRRRRGFTLVEMIVMIMILGMGLSGVMMAINRANRDSAVPFIRKQAIAIAESIMEEVTARAFTNNAGTPSVDLAGAAAAQRNAAHEVDDYNGFTMTGIRAPESPGTIITGLADYSVSVAVAATAFGTVPNTKSKLITVTVNGPADVQVKLEGFKIQYDGG
jgi:MSHA pilin protein MshD